LAVLAVRRSFCLVALDCVASQQPVRAARLSWTGMFELFWCDLDTGVVEEIIVVTNR
jgi:hypothetical protein